MQAPLSGLSRPIGVLQEFAIEMAAATRREQTRSTGWLDAVLLEPCLAVDATNDDFCCYERGHRGPHSWQRAFNPHSQEVH